MAELYTYAVSRIHARESDLLTEGDIEQLLASSNFESALKILRERGYGKDRVYSDFESLRKDEVEKMWRFIRELIPDTEPFETIFRPVDFHNLKAAIKMTFTSEMSEGYFKSGGTVEPDVILEAIKTKDFNSLPEFLRSAAEGASDVFARTGDGQECDIFVDKKCLETMIIDGKNSGVKLIRDYTELYTAVSDIKIAVRGAKMLKSKSFFERSFADCESLDIGALASAAAISCDEVYNYLAHTNYRGAVETLKGANSVSEFEKWADNMIMDLIKGQKSNPFTIQPVFAYIVAKQNELKAVQIILAGKKNNLDNGFIRERLRDLYV